MTWYDELDFAENPFTIKPREELEEYIGQKKILNQILRKVNQKKIIILRGELGTGKTSILKSIINEFKGKRIVYYHNAFSSKQDIDAKKISKNAGGYLSRKLGVETKNIVLLVDEAHVLSGKSFEEITKNFKKTFRAVVLVTSEMNYKFPSQIDKLKEEFQLHKFTSEMAKELVANRLNGETEILPDEMVEKIYDKSKTPREFLQRCEDACKSAVEKGRVTVTVKDF